LGSHVANTENRCPNINIAQYIMQETSTMYIETFKRFFNTIDNAAAKKVKINDPSGIENLVFNADK